MEEITVDVTGDIIWSQRLKPKQENMCDNFIEDDVKYDSSTKIKSENVFDDYGCETNPVQFSMKCEVEDAKILFTSEEEFKCSPNVCTQSVECSSHVLNEGESNLVLAPTPLLKGMTREIKSEKIFDDYGCEDSPVQFSIKCEVEDAQILFFTEEECSSNVCMQSVEYSPQIIKEEEFNLVLKPTPVLKGMAREIKSENAFDDYGCEISPVQFSMNSMKCEVEDAKILFGTKGKFKCLCNACTQSIRCSSEIVKEEEFNLVLAPTTLLEGMTRSDRGFLNQLHDTESFTLKENYMKDEDNGLECDTSAKLPSYKCPDCPKRFKFKGNIKRHQMRMHSKSKSHKCPNCEMSFASKYHLNQHQTSRHAKHKLHKYPDSERNYVSKENSKDKPYNCSDCDGSFVTEHILDKHHRYRHSKVKQHKVPDCDKSFVDKHDLNEHQTHRHSNDKRHKCPDCEKSFTTKYHLYEHQTSRHPAQGSRVKLYKCPDCDMNFTFNQNLKRHQGYRHSKEKPFKCPDCEESFVTKQYLSRHQMSKHFKPKPHKCPDCEFSFDTKQHLNQHQMFKHLKLKSHKCPNCEKSFVTKGGLKQHQMFKHIKLKPHKCLNCEQSFVTKGELKQHQMVKHLKLKPHQCSHCEKSFTSRGKRDQHEMLLHSKP